MPAARHQAEYVEAFLGAVVTFLAFHQNHADLTQRMGRDRPRHAGRKWYCGQDQTHPGRAAGRG